MKIDEEKLNQALKDLKKYKTECSVSEYYRGRYIVNIKKGVIPHRALKEMMERYKVFYCNGKLIIM